MNSKGLVGKIILILLVLLIISGSISYFTLKDKLFPEETSSASEKVEEVSEEQGIIDVENLDSPIANENPEERIEELG